MRICILTENHPLALMGGAEYQTHLLTEELARRKGLTVHYLARRVPSPERAASAGYDVRAIGDAQGIRRRAVFFDVSRLRATLETLRPDVIYEQMKQSYTAVCASYARKVGIPFFLHIASEWDIDTSWFPHHLSANTPFDMLESALGNWGLRRASHIIVQTDAQAQKLRRNFGREPAMLVRNFQPMPDRLEPRPPGPLMVLWVGNLKSVKRPELFVELAHRLQHRKDLQFHMIGRPWGHRRAEPTMRRMQTLSNFTYHGEQPQDRVYELMSRASMYVSTSAHEGFPNTFIQAWARGAVLLSIAVDPYDGMDGLGIGFRTGTLEHMADLIEQLASDADRRDAIAQRSFEFARQYHSLGEGARLADAMIEAATAARQRHNPALRAP